MAAVNENADSWTLEDQITFLARQAERRNERLALYSSLERRLDIPLGFIDQLHSETDDWAYIVKLAVLCEAAVTHALVTKVGDDENREAWYDHFSNLANNRRLELAYKLSVIPMSVKEALDATAQFRNSFAHEVGNLGGARYLSFLIGVHPTKKESSLQSYLALNMTTSRIGVFI